jgi:hypothetical protein
VFAAISVAFRIEVAEDETERLMAVAETESETAEGVER